MTAAFLLASLVLAITPGPAVIYLLTRTLSQGRRAGFASLAGVALGNFGNALAAALGLAALFAVSSLAFTVVKYAGAIYLVYLGIRALFPGRSGVVSIQPETPAAWLVFRDGFAVALLNPKTTLFFAAFLPQFSEPGSSPIAQSVMLGGLFVLVAAATDAIYVLIAARVAPRLVEAKREQAQHLPSIPLPAGGRYGRYGRYLTAASFIGLGLYTAFSSQRAVK